MIRKLCSFRLFLVLIIMLGMSGTLYGDETNTSSLLYQAGSFAILEKGEYSEVFSIDEMNRLGDFGVGGFEDMDGELLQLDGTVYQITIDGVVNTPPGDTGVCFGNTLKFTPESSYTIQETSSLEELNTIIRESLPDPEQIYAVRVDGPFTNLSFRSIPSQEEPYPPLSAVIDNQSVFHLENATGTIAGFWFPEWMDGVNYAGFHLHFITDARDAGGHILNAESGETTLSIQEVDQLNLYLDYKKEEN